MTHTHTHDIFCVTGIIGVLENEVQVCKSDINGMMLLDSLAVPHQPTGITTFAGEVLQFAHPRI